MATSKINKILLTSIAFIGFAESTPAATVTSPRSDAIISIEGTIDPPLKILFGETIYIAANLLNPSCLLRFPDGGFGLVSESRPVDPVLSGNSFQLSLATNHLAGTDLCQFQFAAIKLWIEYQAPGSDKQQPISTFVALLPEGSVYNGIAAPKIETVEHLKCAVKNETPMSLGCAFSFVHNDVASEGAVIPKSGIEIRDLHISF